MPSLINRMIRAAKLDVSLYEEVEADKSALGQAAAVVLISSIAAGIGAVSQLGVRGIVTTAILALLGWVVWAFLTYIIGTKLLPVPETKTDLPEMMRTIGFATSPGVLNVFGFIPFIGGFIALAVAIWSFVAMVIAVRQALDYTSTWRAVGVCIIGFIVYIIISMVLAGLVGTQDMMSGAS
ncbi:MAG: YIP1 family protein [Candidatus Dadabacteria bacterium]|nr:YIP1 family protein [Candidatus Dadabacteria bacterium]